MEAVRFWELPGLAYAFQCFAPDYLTDTTTHWHRSIIWRQGIIRKTTVQDVLCLGSKVSLVGTSLPVWTSFLDGLLIETLRSLLNLDFDTLFCGHAGPCPQGKQRLQDKLDSFLELREKNWALEDNGLNKSEIVSKLFPEKKAAGIHLQGGVEPGEPGAGSSRRSTPARERLREENTLK